MDEETRYEIQQVVNLLLETRFESAAIRRLLVERGLFSSAEIDAAIARARQEEETTLAEEAKRRQLAQYLKKTPTQ